MKQLDADGRPTGELAVPLDQIKRFRQLHSRTPGHPEAVDTSGVETTTGPLGQGVRQQRRDGNRPEMARRPFQSARLSSCSTISIYTFCSDGDLMEGVSNEAASIAGHLKLDNLCWMYDDNHITIEGNTELAFDEDVGRAVHRPRLECAAMSRRQRSGGDRPGVSTGSADRTTSRRSIIVRSHIGWGSPNRQDTAKAHGEALGEEEVRLTKKVYGWPEDAKFLVPDEVREHFQNGVIARGRELHAEWQAKFDEYAKKFPELAEEWQLMDRRELPNGWDAEIPTFPADAKGMATRISSGKVLNAVAKHVPWLIGGAADLAPSTMTLLTFEGAKDFEPGNYGGRNFHFGIREHGMAASLNGMALSMVRPFGATFFVFFDYCKPSFRFERYRPSAGDLHLHARFDRPGRRRPDPSADRASCRRAGDPERHRHAAGRRQRSGRGLAGDHADQRSAGRFWCSRGRTCPPSIARSMPRPAASLAGHMCWPTRRAGSRALFSWPREAKCRYASRPTSSLRKMGSPRAW